jgi:putative intracellular protease/amidase
MPSVLFVFTSVDKTPSGKPTGWYLPEAAHPYYVLSPHCNIDFASPAGPNPPVDQNSVKAFASDAEAQKFLQDEAVTTKLANAKKLSEVRTQDYDAVFYVGGHGPVFDLASNQLNAQLISEFWNDNKIVSAVCHGPAALVDAKDKSGKSIFAGRKVTGFSNEEEEMAGWSQDVPFLLEDKLISLQGKYEKAAEPYGIKVVVDEKLFTGQNPASARPLAEAILKALVPSA